MSTITPISRALRGLLTCPLAQIALTVVFAVSAAYPAGSAVLDLTAWSQRAMPVEGPVTISKVLDRTVSPEYHFPVTVRLLRVRRHDKANQALVTLQLTNHSAHNFILPTSFNQRAVASRKLPFRLFTFSMRYRSGMYSGEQVIAETAAIDADPSTARALSPGESLLVRALMDLPSDVPPNTKLVLRAVCRESIAAYDDTSQGLRVLASSDSVASSGHLVFSFAK